MALKRVLLFILFIVSLIVVIRNNMERNIKKTDPIITKNEKVLTHEDKKELAQNPVENSLHFVENSNTKDVKEREEVNLPSSIEHAYQEKSFLEYKLVNENVVKRLNEDTLTKKEREEYLIIYKRLSFLDSYIMNGKLKEASEILNEIKSTHEASIQKYEPNHPQ